MAKRVTNEGRRDRRFSNQALGFRQQVKEQGGVAPVREGLGEMPLTLWIIVAAIILYLYLRRASLGIDTHPGEKPLAPFYAPRPKVDLRPSVPIVPYTPPGGFGPLKMPSGNGSVFQ